MTAVKIPFEEGELTVPLPDGWRILDPVRPVARAKVVHMGASLVDTLEHPIGGRVPLRAKKRGKRGIGPDAATPRLSDVETFPTPVGQGSPEDRQISSAPRRGKRDRTTVPERH
jgi:hypothetical protein